MTRILKKVPTQPFSARAKKNLLELQFESLFLCSPPKSPPSPSPKMRGGLPIFFIKISPHQLPPTCLLSSLTLSRATTLFPCATSLVGPSLPLLTPLVEVLLSHRIATKATTTPPVWSFPPVVPPSRPSPPLPSWPSSLPIPSSLFLAAGTGPTE